MQAIRGFTRRSTNLVLIAATAVAAFGLTFHYFGSSAQVPEPSRQFGFWTLWPVAIIDRIFILISGNRPIWQPFPMFLVLWAAYTTLAFIILRVIRNRRSRRL